MEKQTIGFDRELDLDWLDLAAGAVLEGLDEQQVRQELLARLADEIPGEKACKNTVTVLTRIWSRVPAEDGAIRGEALTLLPRVAPEDRLWLHWGMASLAYPFFRDVAGTVGRLLHLQEEFGSAQVLRRIRESWGQRTTLKRAVPRTLRSFLSWGVIREVPAARYVYAATPQRRTGDPALALWFMACLLQSYVGPVGRNGGQLPLAGLVQSPAAFPFDLTPHLAVLRRSGRFEISRQGLDLEMVSVVG